MTTYITEIGRLRKQKTELWTQFLKTNPTLHALEIVKTWNAVAVKIKELELFEDGY